MNTDNQPSPWHVGAGLGLSLSCGVLLALYWGGATPALEWLPLAAGLFVFGLGLPIAAWGLAGGAWAVLMAWREWGREQEFGTDVLEAPAVAQEGTFSAVTDEMRAMSHAIDRWFHAGNNAGGFSSRKLENVVGSDTWPALVHFYGSEAGGNILRDYGGDRGYDWGHGWNLDRVNMARHLGKLPYPDMPVPDVQMYVAPATLRSTPRQRKTRQVIDGEVVKA